MPSAARIQSGDMPTSATTMPMPRPRPTLAQMNSAGRRGTSARWSFFSREAQRRQLPNAASVALYSAASSDRRSFRRMRRRSRSPMCGASRTFTQLPRAPMITKRPARRTISPISTANATVPPVEYIGEGRSEDGSDGEPLP